GLPRQTVRRTAHFVGADPRVCPPGPHARPYVGQPRGRGQPWGVAPTEPSHSGPPQDHHIRIRRPRGSAARVI
ncbi:MAG: hypothetical protein RMK32_09840, partial [Anaerolineae bacterium]|nr:hypothetical protein [Anaerolineae bacterium]